MPQVFHQQVVLDDLFIDPEEEVPVRIPFSVQEIFYEMTLAYLIDKPEDPLGFCCDYFENLKRKKTLEIVIADMEPEDVLGDLYHQRRLTVWSSDYIPKEESVDKVHYQKSRATRRELKKSLKEIVLFKSLDTNDISIIVDAMRKIKVEKGETVIVEGDEGNACYLVESGVFHATKKEGNEPKLVETYTSGGFFGELSLLYNAERTTTVVAQTDGVLWALDRTVFRRIVLNKDLEARSSYEKLVRNVPMLSFLTPTEKDRLIDSLEKKYFKDQEYIMKEGDVGDGMYFVMDGKVVITKTDPETKQELKVNILSVGDFFGELALIFNQPRAASAYAKGKVTLAFVSVERFERLLGPCIEIMKRQFDSYEQRLKELFGNSYSMSNLYLLVFYFVVVIPGALVDQ